MAVDAIGGSGVTSLSIRSLEGALGGSECRFQNVAIAPRRLKGPQRPPKSSLLG